MTCWLPRAAVSLVHPDPDRPAKTPPCPSKRGPRFDGTMRRPVAAVEARRSRPRASLMTVAVMEGWLGKRGCRIREGTIRGTLMRVPICNFFAPTYGIDSSSRTGSPSAIRATKDCYKSDSARGFKSLISNEITDSSSSPAVRTNIRKLRIMACYLTMLQARGQMARRARSGSHLVLRGEIWHYRCVVPVERKPAFGCSEVVIRSCVTFGTEVCLSFRAAV
jgi:hypothetical protein